MNVKIIIVHLALTTCTAYIIEINFFNLPFMVTADETFSVQADNEALEAYIIVQENHEISCKQGFTLISKQWMQGNLFYLYLSFIYKVLKWRMIFFAVSPLSYY